MRGIKPNLNMKINPVIGLIAILILTLSFRLYLAFSSPYFDSDLAYFNARIIENIIETKRPFSFDPLSYGGHDIIYPQLFHYIMSFFSSIPEFMKVLPEIFILPLTIIAYFIAKKLTRDPLAALITALLVSFSPALLFHTSNQISVYTLAIPLFYLMLLCLMDITTRNNLYVFIASSFLLPLLHPISFLFACSILFYLVLSSSESLKVDSNTKEAVLFSFFLILLINFILFKKAFLLYGIGIIQQNIPPQLLAQHFLSPNIFNSLYLIGIIPLILGSFGVFQGVFKQKDKNIILLTSILLTIMLLLLLKLIDLSTGLLFFSISLTLIASVAISRVIKYLEITRIHRIKNLMIAAGIFLIIAIVIVPAFFSTSKIITPFEISTLESVARDAAPDATVLAPVSQGHLVSYFTQRKNVADSNFILAPSPQQRLQDIKIAYTTISASKALEIFHKYNIQYIFVSKEAQRVYGISRPPYLDDETCFKQRKSTVYEIKC